MKFKFAIIPLCLILLALFQSGCTEKIRIEEVRKEYYEINRQNSLHLFSGIMYNTPSNTERFKIVHLSDSHLSKWSSDNPYQKPNNLIEAVQYANQPDLQINAMAFTGDFIGNSTKTPRDEAMQYLNAFSSFYFQNNQVPSFTCTGNHDSNMLNPDINEAIWDDDIYSSVTSKINYPIHTEGNSNYYYADLPNPMGGYIRIIALDELDQTDTMIDTQHFTNYTQKQIDWLSHIALTENMTDNHSVVVLLHRPLPSSNAEVLKFIANEHVYSWYMIPDIIEAFRNKEYLKKRYPNKYLKNDTLFIDADFANIPGEFVCYMGGHIHTYFNYEIDGYNNLNPNHPKQIMLIANNMSPSERNPISPIERSDNSTQNNTFNIYAIDTKEKKIYITFFGATLAYYPQVIELQYWNP